MRSFVTAMGLAFYRGECLFIPKEGTRRLAPMNAATLDPITSLQPKDHLQAFAATCDDAIADKRRIDEAVALFDYTATLRYEHDKGAEYAGQGAVKRGLGRLLHTEEAESWRWAHVVNDEEGARARLTATRADGKGDAHLDLEATLLDDGAISTLNVIPVDQASKKWLDLVIEGKEPGSNDGPKWETFDGPWRGAEMNLNVTRSRRWRRRGAA